MSRRSSTSDSDSSLELLLDTITNAFGGILFVAILVVILLRLNPSRSKNEPQPATVQSRENLAAAEEQLIAAMSELESLEAVAASQQKINATERPDLVRQFKDLQSMREKRDAAIAGRADAVHSLSQAQEEINELLDKSSLLDQQLAQAREKRNQAQALNEEEKDKRTRSANLPKPRVTDKFDIPVIVRYGRAYFPYRPETLPLGRVIDTREVFVRTEDSKEVTVTPKPYAGLLLKESASVSAAIRSRLSQNSSARFYVTVGVWPDSFREFSVFKEALVATGYEYRLIPLDEGGRLVEGAVNNPLVQ